MGRQTIFLDFDTSPVSPFEPPVTAALFSSPVRFSILSSAPRSGRVQRPTPARCPARGRTWRPRRPLFAGRARRLAVRATRRGGGRGPASATRPRRVAGRPRARRTRAPRRAWRALSANAATTTLRSIASPQARQINDLVGGLAVLLLPAEQREQGVDLGVQRHYVVGAHRLTQVLNLVL